MVEGSIEPKNSFVTQTKQVDSSPKSPTTGGVRF